MTMTPEELQEALEGIGWSAAQLAQETGRPRQRGYDWITGLQDVPQDVAAWITEAAAWMRENPPPQQER